jgi:hypothetical protein
MGNNLDFEPRRTVDAGDGVLVEGVFTGPTTDMAWAAADGPDRQLRHGRGLRVRGAALVCERVYFDLGTPLRQLGVARDPLSLVGQVTTVVNHPVTIVRALVRSLRSGRRRTDPTGE